MTKTGSSTPTRSVLVLGASGMLGQTLLRYFANSKGFSVTGSVRSAAAAALLPASVRGLTVPNIDVENFDSLKQLFAERQPDIVINAIGLVKQVADAKDPLSAIPINSLLPHRLARLSDAAGARLVHISTDCVFSGDRGLYQEADLPDATDLYGRSKLLGEVAGPRAVTLRTSIIGHELNSAHGLVEWFLAQQGPIEGFTRAVFSGLPTVELARVIRDVVIPMADLCGTYHVSSAPISKYELLTLVAAAYGKQIEIRPSERVVIDRSLDSTRFRERTGYDPPAWPELVRAMKEFG